MTVIYSTPSSTDCSPSRGYYLTPATKSAGSTPNRTPPSRNRSVSSSRSASRSRSNQRNWRQKAVAPQLPEVQVWASFQRKCTQQSRQLKGHRKSNSATNAAEVQGAAAEEEPRRYSCSCTYTPPAKRSMLLADADRPKEPSPKQERGLVGKLSEFSARLFSQAYGLNNTQRREHSDVIEEAYELTGCSERAIRELLYGYSYGTDSELKALRDQVPGYPKKLPQKNRAAQLQRILKHPEKHAFLTFDGNTVDAEAAATATSADETPKEVVSSKTTVASPRSGFMSSVMRFVKTSFHVC